MIMTRQFDFTVGPETSTQPSVSDPTSGEDLISRDYADGRYTQGSQSVANITAIKAIAAADRADGDLIVSQSDNVAYIFDAGSSATGDDNFVLVPDAGTGRWLKATSTAGEPIASSGTGEINYIDEADAETAISGYATYADAAGTTPVDGTGGSANITFTRSTDQILRGTQSYKIAKDAANRQGEGVSYDFTIKGQDTSKKLKIQFDFKTDEDAGYASGDLTVYIYDVTNSLLLTPVDTEIIRGQNIFQTSFNSTTSTSYRLIFHVATTNASAWDAYIDNVIVGPGMTSQGAALARVDVSGITPTNWGTISSAEYQGQREGEWLKVKGRFTAGTVGSSPYIALPSGIEIDTTEFGSKEVVLGRFYRIEDSGTPNTMTETLALFYDGTNTDRLFTTFGSQSGTFNKNQVLTNDNEASFEFEIPVAAYCGKGIVPMLAEDNLSEWQSFTPSFDNFSVKSSTAFYRRVGDSAEFRVQVTHNGAGSGSNVVFNTVDSVGLNIDTTTGPNNVPCGAGFFSIGGNDQSLTPISYPSLNGLMFRKTYNVTVDNIDGVEFSDNDNIWFTATVPIAEWAGSQNSLVGYTEASENNLGLVKKPKTGTIDVSSSGDFSAGNDLLRYTKTPEGFVTIYFPTLSHTSAALVETAAGIVPTSLRPVSDTVGVAYYQSGTDTGSVRIETDGTIQFRYYNTSTGAGFSRSTSGQAGSVTYWTSN